MAQLDQESAREEIRDIVIEIISIKNVVMSIAEQETLLEDICNDVLGYGPLEPLLARDDIADIMVNGANTTYIEVNGKIERTNIRFRDNGQLMNICQRIVSQVGRRVDEASPICDARLADGSRVNVIAPPLAIDGPTLTIRKFKKDKLTIQNLVDFESISEPGAELLRIIGTARCNVLISGGTGSGKTTLLNCLTAFIQPGERVITCEDAAELQLQQPHVVRLETRPPNLEGQGKVFVTTELRGGGTSTPQTIAYADRGIRNFLRFAGNLTGAYEKPAQPSRLLDMPDARCYLQSRHSGIAEYLCELGDRVETGQLVVQIHSTQRTGAPPVEYRAERGGIFVARRFPAMVNLGDTLAVIAEDCGEFT